METSFHLADCFEFRVRETGDLQQGDGMLHLRDNAFIRYFKQRGPVDVLDLGCRVPVMLWASYHNFPCNILVGIDRANDEKWCIEDYLISLKTGNEDEIFDRVINQPRTFFDTYRGLIVESDDPEDIPAIDDRSFFEQRFEVHLQTDVLNFLPGETREFDIIHINNLLHFLKPEAVRTVLIHSRRLLKPGGVIYIRVQNSRRWQEFDYARFRADVEEIIGSGKFTEYRYPNDWHVATFQNYSLV